MADKTREYIAVVIDEIRFNTVFMTLPEQTIQPIFCASPIYPLSFNQGTQFPRMW
jgi:hypothetical protein